MSGSVTLFAQVVTGMWKRWGRTSITSRRLPNVLAISCRRRNNPGDAMTANDIGAVLTLDEVANLIHKSRRWLREWLRDNPRDAYDRPLFGMAGRTLLFTEMQVQRLTEALKNADTEAQERRAERKARDPGYIYFVKSGDFIKIGYSRSLAARFHKLRTDAPVELELLHIEGGSVKQEKCLPPAFRGNTLTR